MKKKYAILPFLLSFLLNVQAQQQVQVPTDNKIAWYKSEDLQSNGMQWNDAAPGPNYYTMTSTDPVTIVRKNFYNVAQFNLGRVNQKFVTGVTPGWPTGNMPVTYYYVARFDNSTTYAWAITRGSNNTGLTSGRHSDNRVVIGNSYTNGITGKTWNPYASKVITMGDNGSQLFYSIDGEARTTNANRFTEGNNGIFYIGGRQTNDEDWSGEVCEVIVYSGTHTPEQAKRVETYLAIKYGLTLQGTQDYVTGSSNTRMWTATTGFNNSIFGLAKLEELNQKVSQSSNTNGTEGILTVATNNDFTSLNTVTSRTSLAEGEYILFGANNITTTALESLPATVINPHPEKTYRLTSRKWMVQPKDNSSYKLYAQIDLTKYNLSFDGVYNKVYMVVADDAGFTQNVTVIPHTSVENNKKATFEYTFTKDQYVAFMVPYVPTMVPRENIVAWYKGENATSGTWPDVISAANNTTNTGNNVNITTVNFNRQPFFDAPGNQAQKYRTTTTLTGWPGRQTPQTYYLIARGRGTRDHFSITKQSNTGGLTVGDIGTARSLSIGQYYNNERLSSFWEDGRAKVVVAGDNGTQLFYSANGLNRVETTSNRFNHTAESQFFIGGDESNGPDDWDGDISEVIVYNTAHNEAITKKVQTYLAIKYGGTLENGQGYTDLNDVVMWNNTLGGGRYNFTIAGLANLAPLDQRIAQSSSLFSVSKILTIATNNDFTSLNNVSTRTSLTPNDYILFGSNGVVLTGADGLEAVPSTVCVTPSATGVAKQMIKRKWLMQPKDGGTYPIFGQVDLSPYGITAEAFMVVADDEAFSQNVSVVPMSAVKNGKATFQYTFTKDVFVSFGGVVIPGICESCTFQGVNTINFANSPGSAAKVFTPGQNWTWTVNEGPTPDPADDFTATFNFTGTFDGNTPREFWRSGIILQKKQETVTAKITMSSAALVSFYVKDLDEWQGRHDKVTITGVCGTATVKPKLSILRNGSYYTLPDNAISNPNIGPHGYDDMQGKMLVEFTTAVKEINITYSTTGGGGDYSQDIGLDDFRFSCPPPPPPVPADGVSITKDVSKAAALTCEAVEYSIRLNNTRCFPQTVNITDNLPAGMYWVDNSLTGLLGTSVTANAYADGQTLTITNFTIPGGSSVVIKAKARFNAVGTFNNRATLTMGNGNTYQSVDTYYATENTVVTATGDVPPQKPLKVLGFAPAEGITCIKKGGQVKVVLTFNNPNASYSYQGIMANMILGAGFTYVANSVSSGTAVATADGSLNVSGITVAPGTQTLTFTVTAPNNISDTSTQITVIQSLSMDKAAPIIPCDAIEMAEGASSLIVPVCPNPYLWVGRATANAWDVKDNWSMGHIPMPGDDVEFATAAKNGSADVADPKKGPVASDLNVPVVDGGKTIGNLINATDKNLAVTPGSMLTIAGTVQNTGTGTLVIQSAPDKSTGTLKFTSEAYTTASPTQTVNATVQFYNKGYNCNCGIYPQKWQYFGIPVLSASAFPNPTTGLTVNRWDEFVNGNKWVGNLATSTLNAFEGYEITSTGTTVPTTIYPFTGQLITGNRTIDFGTTPRRLTYTSGVNYIGMNLIGNSYTAAIPITTAGLTFSGSINSTVYLFNTGTRDEWRKLNGSTPVTSATGGIQSGTYLAVPINNAGAAGLPDRIPSMHAFMVKVTGTTPSLTINYGALLKNDLVNGMAWRSGRDGVHTVSTSQNPYLVMDVIGSRSADRVWLFENPSTTRGFDNGWDGHKLTESGIVQLYVSGAEGDKFQVATVPDITGTEFGFVADVDENYTIVFDVTAEIESRCLYLRDLHSKQFIPIRNGTKAMVKGIKGDTGSRFRVVSGTTVVDKISSSVEIVANNRIISVINHSDENCTAYVYDISGRLSAQCAVKAKATEYLNIPIQGVYVVKVMGQTVNEVKRVVN
ncbi:MAG: hypothetical protein Q4G63_00870 [Bacteroidia bacterium]|nr:hypothetical protein [Bacteroidia bacterium]